MRTTKIIVRAVYASPGVMAFSVSVGDSTVKTDVTCSYSPTYGWQLQKLDGPNMPFAMVREVLEMIEGAETFSDMCLTHQVSSNYLEKGSNDE